MRETFSEKPKLFLRFKFLRIGSAWRSLILWDHYTPFFRNTGGFGILKMNGESTESSSSLRPLDIVSRHPKNNFMEFFILERWGRFDAMDVPCRCSWQKDEENQAGLFAFHAESWNPTATFHADSGVLHRVVSNHVNDRSRHVFHPRGWGHPRTQSTLNFFSNFLANTIRVSVSAT